MGYYIETHSTHDKAATILSKVEGAELVDGTPRWEDLPEGRAYICVVDNRIFEAAAFAYDADEFKVFSDPSDYRPKQWLTIPRETAEHLTGYNGNGIFDAMDRVL